MDLNRRAVLGALGGLAFGGALAATVGQVAAAPFDQSTKPFGWTPHKLDAAACAKTAYEGYWFNDYGCCYGAFYAIVGTMAEKFGAPYNQFPFTMMEVGKSGISEWGTICGALLGVASAYSLFWGRKERNPMVTELFRWYEQTAFPMYNPGEAAQGVKGELPTSKSDSVLCHISVSRWCYTSKLAQSSKERSERCSRITADVTAKGIAILNAKIDGAFKPEGKSEAVAYCGECHDKGKAADNAKGLMDCRPCHSGSEHTQNKFQNHP
ncbi:C-GCAxxG-C-C family protein [Solidesulfovibrio sp.]|uniref:split-Soret cytochrome c n=1 Tax=Solidesulfovibrio sp. TaxID=2910990 RepID=UPI00262A1D31|nr:C-GCAxxG-C-C family protein [Solidesulfovibrio sp.]